MYTGGIPEFKKKEKKKKCRKKNKRATTEKFKAFVSTAKA